MKKLFLLLVVFSLAAIVLYAEEEIPSYELEGAPWLKGVTIGPVPTELSPVVPMQIFLESGEPIPATLTEDIPLNVVADTALFDPTPPSKYKEQVIPNPVWTKNVSIAWHLIDWEANVTTIASSSLPLAANQMEVVPITPTGRGAIVCYAGRKMRYDVPESGISKGTYANSSVGADVRVLDITPPTCGLQISVKGGEGALVWVEENPPNKYPLPKLADVCLQGALVNEADPEEIIRIPEFELGTGMMVSKENAAISVSADSVIKIEPIGDDNYRLDETKLKYGICADPSSEPISLAEENANEINLAEIKLPKQPYFFVDASDTTGNREILFVPIKVLK